MSSAPRTTTPSISLLVRPASTRAFLIASSSSASELAPTWPSRLLPVPTMAYLSLKATVMLSLLMAPALADLQALQTRQHLVAQHRHFIHIIDEDQRHPVQSGF